MPKYMKIQKSPYYKDYSKCPEIQGPKERKTYSNIYKEEWTQPWPMGS